MDTREKLIGQLETEPTFTVPPLNQSKVAAVLVPIGQLEDGREEIVLTKRTRTVQTHKGQVSFPGGIWEPQDESLKRTALRESMEEVGTHDKDIDVWGSLPMVTTRGALPIQPWVGRLRLPYPFVPCADEVDRILYLPLRQLIQEGLKPCEVRVGGMRVQSVGIHVSGELVWGATAKVLQELRSLLL